jgi:hypothetical protein
MVAGGGLSWIFTSHCPPSQGSTIDWVRSKNHDHMRCHCMRQLDSLREMKVHERLEEENKSFDCCITSPHIFSEAGSLTG